MATARYIVTVTFSTPRGVVESEASIQHLADHPFEEAVEEIELNPGNELLGVLIQPLDLL